MIAAATLLWAIEVVIARRLLFDVVPSPLLGAARMGIGLVVLLGYLAASGRLPIMAGLTATQWAWAAVTGALLAAYVSTWLAALRRAPASVVASVLVIGAPITAGLQAIANGALPGPSVVGGLSVITVAVCVLAFSAVRSARRTRAVTA